MRNKRRCDYELPRQSCRLGLACVDNFTQVQFWFCLELPRKGSAKGGGIRDARAKVRPVNWLTPETQDPETQPHFAHSGGKNSCTASIGSRQPRKILRTAFGKQFPCGRLILTHRSHIKRRCFKLFKAHSSQEVASEVDCVFKRRDRGIMWGRRKNSRHLSCIKVVAGRGQGARMPIRCCQALRSAASLLHYLKLVGRS